MPLIPIAPMFNWSLGAMRFLKMVNAWLLKEDATMPPPTRAAEFCKKFLRDVIEFLFAGLKLRLFAEKKVIWSYYIVTQFFSFEGRSNIINDSCCRVSKRETSEVRAS